MLGGHATSLGLHDGPVSRQDLQRPGLFKNAGAFTDCRSGLANAEVQRVYVTVGRIVKTTKIPLRVDEIFQLARIQQRVRVRITDGFLPVTPLSKVFHMPRL